MEAWLRKLLLNPLLINAGFEVQILKLKTAQIPRTCSVKELADNWPKVL